MTPFQNDVSDDKVASIFALMCLHEVTNTHLLHWSSKSYSQHKALGSFYDSLQDLTDDVIEAYMGKYGQIMDFPDAYAPPKSDPVSEIEDFANNVKQLRDKLPQDSELQTLIDPIADLCDSTLYKLRFLK
jgi:hypothetical protein